LQFFGVGFLELLVIMVLTVLVVGPDRLPEAAAQIARFIRQARSYANYVAKDFNEVVTELEKEVGASREDWKEIASIVGGPAASIARELERTNTELKAATDLTAIERDISTPREVLANGAVSPPEDSTAVREKADPSENGAAVAKPPSDDEWFVPGAPRSRRRADDGV
jgi:sec-independent protein translocase protein TatB